ncbi:MAG: hypothetical protein HYV09_07350 [Deltaproteobacteria bacterium]|nr:hypothetical protein [Deltaproteobacteria bacterium]
MRSDVALLAAGTIGYLALLFSVARVVDRGGRAVHLARSPVVQLLALGIYASTWTFYGTVGFARRTGFLYLAIYLGPTIACLAAPLIWERVLRVSREQRLSSVADLFAARFRSPAVGAAVTVLSVTASVPYLAQQIRAVEDATTVLVGTSARGAIAVGFAAVLAAFAVLFGARSKELHEPRGGLVVAVALESLVKLVALIAVAIVATAAVGGLGAVDARLRETSRAAIGGPTWTTLILLSASAFFLLPRQFHVAFAEGSSQKTFRRATAGFPLYLLATAATFPFIVAAANQHPELAPDVVVLALPRRMGASVVTLLAFLGGISAAFAMVSVTAIALAAMVVHHLVLPLRPALLRHDAYGRVRNLRAALIVALVACGLLFALARPPGEPLADFGLVSFVAFAQLLPALVAALFARGASAVGVLAGLAAGTVVWVMTALIPWLSRATSGVADPWTLPTWASLAANVIGLAVGSTLRPPRAEERDAAARFVDEPLAAHAPGALARSPREFLDGLAPLLGEATARAEVERACRELGLGLEERRPEALRAIRDRLLQNLSRVVGPIVARTIVDAAVDATSDPGDRLRELDARLAVAGPLSGAAAEIDRVRRHLRAVVDRLPMGVCVVDGERRVVLWSEALAHLTSVVPEAAVGLGLLTLPAPWGSLLDEELDRGVDAEVQVGSRRVRVRRARLEGDDGRFDLLLVEDMTERRALEDELVHRDRLAAIGRLAAGVAHEIGNPLTGITSLVQNLRDDVDDDARARLDLVLTESRRIAAIVRALLGYSRNAPEALDRRPVSLREIAEEAARLVRLDRERAATRTTIDLADDLVVVGDRPRLTQLVVNLLTNACDAAPSGTVRVSGERDGDAVVLRIADDGAGMPESVRARIFEPFFTTKPVGRGTGLGLSLVEAIARAHGGTVDVQSVEGRGTTMIVRMPSAGAG